MSEQLTFPGGRGHSLAAALERPSGRARAWAIFAHCFTCSKDIVAAGRISRALAGEGFAVLRFDFTGLGNSDGDFANTNFSSNVADLIAAADYLRDEHEAPRLLVGHSLGGAAVIAAAGQIPEVSAIATIGAPSDPEHVTHLLADQLDELSARGEAEVTLAARTFRIQKQFVDDLAAQNLAAALDAYRGALLIYHAPRDEIVGIRHAQALFVAARHPKSFVSLDGANHLLTRKADAEFVGRTLAAWSDRYVAEPTRPAGPPEGVVRVSEIGPRYAQRIEAASHLLVADEPTGVGGLDAGPTPYDYLLAGLGACTSMTLRMYANRKGWPLGHVAVSLSHEKIHATDCAACETETGRVDRITREIDVRGPLDADQLARLTEIADRCPVHRTLENEKEIVTRLRAGDEGAAGEGSST